MGARRMERWPACTTGQKPIRIASLTRRIAKNGAMLHQATLERVHSLGADHEPAEGVGGDAPHSPQKFAYKIARAATLAVNEPFLLDFGAFVN
ncbi:hypothetical protein QTI66_37320 [Variovorax sp. J22R133]|uniref:hypothetical protein n=1 Tax=Variovorax brevis TaxID=3053503 RepID=UPI002575C289|nr:hypothetical protein [Variovorax sp. J22R133]MDM0117762.1 hypothetical protein [Variovorax sp. J22R133]